MEPRLNIITLGVTDFARAVEFYSTGLGWEKSPASQESIAFFQLGGLVLSIYPRPLLAEDATISMSSEKYAPFSLAYNAKSEEDVDSVIRLAVSKGATLVKPAQKVFWGGYSGYFADPDGFLWEVAYNPFMPFDENNNLKLP